MNQRRESESEKTEMNDPILTPMEKVQAQIARLANAPGMEERVAAGLRIAQVLIAFAIEEEQRAAK